MWLVSLGLCSFQRRCVAAVSSSKKEWCPALDLPQFVKVWTSKCCIFEINIVVHIMMSFVLLFSFDFLYGTWEHIYFNNTPCRWSANEMLTICFVWKGTARRNRGGDTPALIRPRSRQAAPSCPCLARELRPSGALRALPGASTWNKQLTALGLMIKGFIEFLQTARLVASWRTAWFCGTWERCHCNECSSSQ